MKSPLYEHEPHPWVRERAEAGAPKIADQFAPQGNAVQRINVRIADIVCRGVGTMWCAYGFALFDCLALPTALRQGAYGIVQWVASFFLQLVLLSIVMVNQNSQAAAADQLSKLTYLDGHASFEELHKVQEHLAQQDLAITEIRSMLGDINKP